MKVKAKITSDFTNHSVNGCLKICVKCAYGTLFSLWYFLVNNSTKSAQNP